MLSPYTNAEFTTLPLTAARAAMTGADKLVPPTVYQHVGGDAHPSDTYTITPELGLALNDMSGTARAVPHADDEYACCALEAVKYWLHPPPELLHPSSAASAPDDDVYSVVPPTAMTDGDIAGKLRPAPTSPADAKYDTVLDVKYVSNCVYDADSATPKLMLT